MSPEATARKDKQLDSQSRESSREKTGAYVVPTPSMTTRAYTTCVTRMIALAHSPEGFYIATKRLADIIIG